MKKIISLVVLAGILFFIYTLVSKDSSKVLTTIAPPDEGKQAEAVTPAPKSKQGKITIINTDSQTQLPIANSSYLIMDIESGKAIETVMTDAQGKATSGKLDYGTYSIKQESVNAPFQLTENEEQVKITSPSQEIALTNPMLDYVKEITSTGNGQFEIKKVYLNVDTIMQNPELPNGCEITSLTAVLQYYGYDATKTEMADNYLPKQAFYSKNNKLYGPDPYEAYAGDPRELKGGFFSFAPPIVKAAELYFDAVGHSNPTKDISGSTKEQIIEQLNHGIPVVTWITLDLSKPKMNYSWYLSDSSEYFPAPINLHVVVLNGYENGKVHVMNPLVGQVTYDMDKFFNSYVEMGSHAMIVGNN
ncbi:uncharacterized protein YvpB [Paenibacillus castaneae]|uniref:C39 family peptidase n=1 Tax=Paenibacillus castaneae TaxID=474957 RepID=UPI000C9A4482|nr:C39 family peptidase [Paenibacillus castaneae]NIK79837.1 uncharacterized protein YvpB [Paenibacillus castaneae]